MIEPPPASVIGSMTALMPSIAPVRFTSSTCCHLATSRLFNGPTATMPALFTSTLSLPNFATAVSTAACHWS